MNKFKIALVAMLVVGAASCKTLKKSSPASKQTRQIVKTLSQNTAKFEYLKGKAKINYQEEKRNINLTASVRVQSRKKLWISVSPGLGIEVFRCLFTQDSVYAIDKINQQYYALDYQSISQKYNIGFSYQLVESVFLGQTPFGLEQADQAQKTKTNFELTKQLGDYKIMTYYNIATALLEKMEIDQTNGPDRLLVDYLAHTLVEKNYFPMQTTVRLITDDSQGTDPKTNITINFKRLEHADKQLSMPFDKPSNYPVISKP